jgi:hypothetical protein
MRIPLLVILMGLVVAPIAQAKIYQKIDKDGNASFSDIYMEGATEINLPEPQVISGPPTAPAAEKQSDDVMDGLEEVVPSISIDSPKHDEVFVNSENGEVPIDLGLTQKLQPGQLVQMLLNGKPIGDPQAATKFKLQDLYRGTHTLLANIIDAENKVVASSQQVTIHMQRPMIRNRAPNTNNSDNSQP